MMKRTALATLAATLAVGCAGPQTPDSVNQMARSEVETIVKDYLISNPEVLKDALDALEEHQKENLFSELISNPNDPTIGPEDAPITIVEFFDYNCGFCRQATDWVFEQTEGRENDIRVVFKEYPILAQSSLDATEAAYAAMKQGKYREMHLAMMKAPELNDERIEKIATSIGLDMDKFNQDREDASIITDVERVYAEAGAAGVEGTPGFFINGEFHNGFRKAQMDELLAKVREEL